MKVLNRKLVAGIRAGKRDYFCRASLEVIFKEVRLGAVKVDEFAIGEMVKGKDSWSKKILTLADFRGYPEKTRPDIEIEEWSKK